MMNRDALPPPGLSAAEARELQLRLRDKLILHPPAGFAPGRIAGADVSMERGSNLGFAGITVLHARSLSIIEEASAAEDLPFPYVPGLLSFRELPPLVGAWEKLERKPDLLIFDGQGRAHPRRFGLACHGGLSFDVPSIGCAKSLLVGEHEVLGKERGSTAELVHRGEMVGMAVRTRTGVRPVYVSAGHRMDLATAVEWVLRAAPRYREPETTRSAHRLVNRMREEHRR